MNKYVTNLTLPNGTNVLIKDSECRTNLSNEIRRATAKETELEEADTHLRNDLTTETNARKQRDTALQQNINSEVSAREQGDNKNNAEIAKIHTDITGIENKNSEQDDELSTLRTMLSSPYNFKGDVASISELPASGEVNDTYYVQDVKYKVTWNGSAWVQSSMSEADYETEMSELKNNLFNFLKGNNIIDTTSLKYGFIQSSDGTIYDGGSAYKYSDLIPVNDGDIFLYYGRGSDGVLIIGAYETETGDAIVSKSVVGNDTNMKQVYVVPHGINYIRMTSSAYYDEPSLIFLKNDKYARGIKGGDFNDFAPSSTPYIINYGYNYTNATRYDDSGILYCYEDYTTNIIWQMFIPTDSKNLCLRRKVNNSWGPWSYELKEKEISILFVGNSLTQDGIAYLPYLLKTYYPEVKFRFYMWYNGGFTLDEHYEYFMNDTACDIFSVCENGASWTNYNSSKKMSEILSSYTFDVVCMQEYFNYKTSYTEDDLIDWNNCKDYITSHYTGGNPLEFISLFHAPKRSDSTTIFNRTVEGNNLILQNTIAQDMIPNGIAVYRALSTDLANLGDEGNLSPDGTHTQEGLPCLLQTYVTACWLLDKLGIARSVYGCPMRMTTDIYNTLNVPGANLGTGVITGTDAQNVLAQEVAIKAYKEGKYYVNNNIFKIN